ncbi:UNVERIFIED_CONTAM: hypothetical protein HDU68_006452, partial [Siphonaria sp. JEL0065]
MILTGSVLCMTAKPMTENDRAWNEANVVGVSGWSNHGNDEVDKWPNEGRTLGHDTEEREKEVSLAGWDQVGK